MRVQNQLQSVVSESARLLKLGYQIGLGHLLVSSFFVQGLTYVAQLLLARLIGPTDFGIVRNVEATISIVILLASIGMPSLAVKAIAEAQNGTEQGRLLGRLLMIVLVFSMLAAAMAFIVLPAFVTVQARPYFQILVWSAALTAFSRTCINYFQGIKQVHRMALLNTVLSLLSLSAIIGLAVLRGLDGWLVGRYVGEILFVGGSIWAVWKSVSFVGALPQKYAYGRLLFVGTTIAVSFVLRTTLDNAALLSLGFWGRHPEEIGYYGLSNLVATGALLISGVTANVMIPRFVEKLHDQAGIRRLFLQAMRWTATVMVGLALLAILLAPAVIQLLFTQYLPAITLMQILLLTVPIRALGQMCSVLFIAADKNVYTLVANGGLLALALPIYAYYIPQYGALGAAWGTLLVESIGMIIYVLGGFLSIRYIAPNMDAANLPK